MKPRGCRTRTAQEVRVRSKPANRCDQPVVQYDRLLRCVSFTCFRAGADPYVIIHCEGRSVRSTIKKDTLKPEFATSGVFYRKKPRKPITIEVRRQLSGPDDCNLSQ